MMRVTLPALVAGIAVLTAASAPAQAQLFLDGLFGAPQRSAAPSRPSRQQAQQKRRQQPQQTARPADDDDDEDERPQVQRRTQPVAAAASRPRGKGPAVMDGGGRPAIGAMSPPMVSFSSGHAAGSVVIDTRARSLYYVLGGGRAYRYPIAVGRVGFTWTGTQRVSRVASWPDWRPPAEMRQRQPYLPELMTGGIRNPLGAKAIYLGSTLYRIHGTNDARSIGSASSSGCFRMTNGHVTHLASLVGVGTAVHVLRGLPASSVRGVASRGSSAAADRS